MMKSVKKSMVGKKNDCIAYKGIVHNVLNDAPFIGAVIIACACNMSCKDCLNEHLKQDVAVVYETSEAIISKVLSNGLNQGIILSGLEWTEQPEDLLSLVECALKHQLEVIVYTHHLEKTFFEILPNLENKPIYVKFGLYDSAFKNDNYFSHTVKLATSNQFIKYFGDI